MLLLSAAVAAIGMCDVWGRHESNYTVVGNSTCWHQTAVEAELPRGNCWTNTWFSRGLDNRIAKAIAGMWLNCVCCTCCHTYQRNSLPLFMDFALYLGHWVHTMQRMSHHLIPPRLKILIIGDSSCTFCMMSISSGLRSRSMDEMLSMLFLRTMPAANGLAMIPGEAWAPKRVVNQM